MGLQNLILNSVTGAAKAEVIFYFKGASNTSSIGVLQWLQNRYSIVTGNMVIREFKRIFDMKTKTLTEKRARAADLGTALIPSGIDETSAELRKDRTAAFLLLVTSPSIEDKCIDTIRNSAEIGSTAVINFLENQNLFKPSTVTSHTDMALFAKNSNKKSKKQICSICQGNHFFSECKELNAKVPNAHIFQKYGDPKQSNSTNPSNSSDPTRTFPKKAKYGWLTIASLEGDEAYLHVKYRICH
ncbi:hypothetical protein NCAS_0J01070 [Naumovozyma castellii]|uniref:Uncharacterized protein n=1 Tax=Naumovozyma castellii TaxID=27288 RepID=G0VKP9_NAUCA|nr:hypothetical protein NCAS_0J01070 [Naumovozyma castellii CBS 4309]CCC72086.1 hypothetical protein NCAS_0J01070 [Naumovozyma castellii CBS 4309]